MIKAIQPLINKFLPFAQERMGFHKPPRIFLKDDGENAKDPLGKTAYYDPEQKSVTIYITDRHPKDIMRSLSHELVHHTQNCSGELSKGGEMGEGYAQKDEHLREMERQAYETGNLCFRDWEDGIKNTIYYESLHKGEKEKMSFRDWKNGELTTILSEAFGFKFDLDKLTEDVGGAAGELTDKEAKEKDYVSKREKEGNLEEDSGAEEGEHYEDDAMHDDDHIKAIEHHLDALKHDRDYDEDHIDEGGAAARTGNEDKDVGRNRMHADRVHEEDELDEDADSLGEVAGVSTSADPRRAPYKRTPVPDAGDPGDEDYATKRGTRLKHGGKGRGEKKGDKAYVNEAVPTPKRRISEDKIREILTKAIEIATARNSVKE